MCVYIYIYIFFFLRNKLTIKHIHIIIISHQVQDLVKTKEKMVVIEVLHIKVFLHEAAENWVVEATVDRQADYELFSNVSKVCRALYVTS